MAVRAAGGGAPTDRERELAEAAFGVRRTTMQQIGASGDRRGGQGSSRGGCEGGGDTGNMDSGQTADLSAKRQRVCRESGRSGTWKGPASRPTLELLSKMARGLVNVSADDVRK